MFGSSTLDVAIGLVFLYLLLSLLCTAINEVLEAAVQKRGEYLRYGIAELLGVAPNVNAGNWVRQLVSYLTTDYAPFKTVADGLRQAKIDAEAAKIGAQADAAARKVADGVNDAVKAMEAFVSANPTAPELIADIMKAAREAVNAAREATDKNSARADGAAPATTAGPAAGAGPRTTGQEKALLQEAADRLDAVERSLRSNLLAKVYTHPLVASLYSGTYGTDAVRLPAYIPARQFALALLDIVLPAGASGSGAAFAGAGAKADPQAVAQHIANLRAAVAAAGNGLTDEVRAALLALIDAAGNDMERIRDGIEQWYNGTMDRVAGWYRRRVQYVSVAVGAVMAVVLNADTFAIADSLARDQVLRATVASAADNYAKAHAPAGAQPKADEKAKTDGKTKADEKTQAHEKVKTDEKATTDEQKAADVKAALDNVSKGVNEVRGFGWPLGWDFADDRTVLADPLRRLCIPGEKKSYQWKLWSEPVGDPPHDTLWVWDWRAAGGWFIKALGWVLTAAAISLGAPFWFDILNRLIVIRSTVKPTEKSPDEPSADRK